MAKISPVSIKYMVKLKFKVDGAVEKPDVIGALFGQTEGLLGSDLEMRDLQKEGKIGRIEVELESEDGKTFGVIEIPTALDKSETTLIAAAVETIDRIGPTDAKIEVESIEDVRGNKRDFIIERAKKLMANIGGDTDSREISDSVKTSVRTSKVQEYGEEKLPAGDLSGDEVIVVEGRADVMNLLKNNVKNVIGMNGTKLPAEIAKLGKEKKLTLFVDGDRGGKLIAKNVIENAEIFDVASAPEGKEVEELNSKEILMSLRQKVSVREFIQRNRIRISRHVSEPTRTPTEIKALTDDQRKKISEISEEVSGKHKAVFLDDNMRVFKRIGSSSLAQTLRRIDDSINTIIVDGAVTSGVIKNAEEKGVQNIMAKNFAAVDTSINLISF